MFYELLTSKACNPSVVSRSRALKYSSYAAILHACGAESLSHQTGRRVGGLSAAIITTDDCRTLWDEHEQSTYLSFDERTQATTTVWGSLTLAPNNAIPN